MNSSLDCFICLKTKPIKNLINVFEKSENENKNIADIINKHLSLTITEQTSLTLICVECLKIIQDFHSFYCEIESAHGLKFEIEKVVIKCEVDECSLDEPPQNDPSHDKSTASNDIAVEDNESVNNEEKSEDDDTWMPTPRTRKTSKKIEVDNKSTSESRKKLEEGDQLIQQFMKIECDICGNSFNKFYLLNSHFKKCHDKKGYLVCCETRIFSRSDALHHIKKHSNPDLFKCKICSKTLANLKGLTSHMYLHSSKDDCKFKCDDCPKSFAKYYLLQSHRRRHQPANDIKFTCDLCDKAYCTKQMLQEHTESVHFNQQYVCEICAKSFKNKAWFKIHVREHQSTESKVQCDKCARWCKNNVSLKKHMKKHDEIKLNLCCDVCGKQAPSKTALRVHKFNLHGAGKDKKFPCCICSKIFKRSSALKEHIAVHTGEDLYTCNFCMRTFKSSANMYSHRKKCSMKSATTEPNNNNSLKNS